MLQHYGVTPYIIFDGDYLPSKAATETDRAKRREDSKGAGMELLNAGKTSQAYLEFQKAVDVTPEMARQLIDELKKHGVQYIVAPYEADAQMVYLERKGIIDGIISEDSDLLVFGAKCLLTKLDQYGNCVEINKADFCACKEITLTGWTDKEFRTMAILSGCDYLASINNMGLKTAYRMVRKHKTIEKVIRMLQFDGKFHVPKSYLDSFYQAELTFLHQRVFCPIAQTLVLHTEPEQPIDEDKMHYIGALVDPKIARGVATGDLNPMTKRPIVVDSRSRAMASSSPWPSSRNQENRSLSSNDLKKGVSLETFFKKRTPLAELDLNLFTPSPTQQDALRRNSGPWMTSPAPRPYLNRSTTELQPLSQTAPPLARTQSTRVRTPTVSEPRPQKRARLCAEIDSPTKKGELESSRFFGAKAEPSPSVRKTNRSKRSKKEEINIFSDEAVEEIMLGLPDVDGFREKSGKKISIFEETTEIGDELMTQGYATITDSQDSTPSLTSTASTTSSAEQPPTPANNRPLQAIHKPQKFEFYGSGNPTPKSVDASRILLTPTSIVGPRQSRIPVAVKSKPSVLQTSSHSQKVNKTPLSRLGAFAMNRQKLPMTPPDTPTLSITPKRIGRSHLSKGGVPFPEEVEKIKAVIEPASVPLPIPDENENKALNMTTGSEDLILHDSEAEDGGSSPVANNEQPSLTRIDFTRFAYAG